MTRWLGLVLACTLALPATAGERIAVCYNYGCYEQVEVVYSEPQLLEIGALLRAVGNASEEREALGRAIGRMLGWAGAQSPIKADRGGNYADAGVPGMMDCIDHSTTTTRLLRVLEARGALRFHRVLEPALRSTLLVFRHYSAQIEERAPVPEPARYVVDSWFFDNGEPAAVMPLANWMAGENPSE